jgi:hypothetical protein
MSALCSRSQPQQLEPRRHGIDLTNAAPVSLANCAHSLCRRVAVILCNNCASAAGRIETRPFSEPVNSASVFITSVAGDAVSGAKIPLCREAFFFELLRY